MYGIAFQNDGALACTGDLGGIALVWDLRSGKNVHALKGHAKQILACDFSSNGCARSRFSHCSRRFARHLWTAFVCAAGLLV